LDVPVKIQLRYLAIVLVCKRQVVKGLMWEVLHDHLVDFSGKVRERHRWMTTAVERRRFGDVGSRVDRVVSLESALSLCRTYGEMCVFVGARPDR